MGYQPFLIAPFGTGLDTDLEPWLLPQDAFTNIENGHIHHGYVEKRRGYRFLGDMVHGSPISAATAASPAVFTIASTLGLADGRTITLHYLAGGNWANLNGAKYTVTIINATTFSLTDVDGTAVNGAALGVYTANSGRLGRLEQIDSSALVTAATTANPAVFTSVVPVVNGDLIFLSAMAGGTWTTLNNQWFTVDNISGTTFNLKDNMGLIVDGSGLGVYTGSTGTAYLIKKPRMMGIFRYIGSDNTRELLISDTERVAIYNAASNLFDPLDLYDSTATLRTDSDVWASTELDYIWAANWQHAGSVNRVYVTNGKAVIAGPPGTDGIVFYDAVAKGAPSTPNVEQFQPSLNASDTLYGCKLIFSIRQRLVCLHTFEFNGATTNIFPQRARWCAGQNPGNWNDSTAGGGGFVDAPTGEQIISARQLQDIIIVTFTDSVWTLRPVPDPALPFRWDKINDFRACDGKMASVGYDRYVVSLGQRGIIATDGVESRRIDQRIEDFVDDEINDGEFGKVFAARNFQSRRTWILYPRDTGDADNAEADGELKEEANSALIYDDESGAYSKYLFTREIAGDVVDMNVLGYGGVAADYAAQDFIEANGLDVAAEDLEDETALSFFWSEGAELFLGGDRNGTVYILETEGSDFGNSIKFTLETAGWNPFQEQGVEAQFGYIDFYCDSDQKTKLKVEFYKNDSETPYENYGMDLLPNLNYRSSVSNVTPNADPTTGFVIVSNSHGLLAGENFYIYGIEGSLFYNDREYEISSVTENTITIAQDITLISGTAITGITQASPGVVTSVGHNFQNGDIIYIVDVDGMIEVNGNVFTVSNKTDDTYELLGVNTTAFTAYSGPSGFAFYSFQGGGQIVERKFFRTKVWKRLYAGGVGYVHQIKISSEGVSRPLRIHAMKPWFRPRGRRTLG